MRAPAWELTPAAALAILLRHRRTVLAWTLGITVLLLGIALIRRPTYTSSSAFINEGAKVQSGLSGIAAQFGVALPAEDAGLNPAVYVDLVKSRQFLGDLVDSKFISKDAPGGQMTLVDVYGGRGNAVIRRDGAITYLQKHVSAAANARTGVVSLTVTASTPQLAAGINQKIIDLLVRFNMVTRQSRAAAERQFTERRRTEVASDLRAAEDRLQEFLQRNVVANSAELALQRERLSRDVTMQQQLYTGIAQAYEQAKIAEIRDTPVITILEPPQEPVKSDPRRFLFWTASGLFIGVMIGIAVAFLRESRTRAQGRSDFDDLSEVWRETRDGLFKPLSRIRKRSASDTA